MGDGLSCDVITRRNWLLQVAAVGQLVARGDFSLAASESPSVVPARLPWATVFRGRSVWERIVALARQQEWSRLPLGQRVARVAWQLRGIRYENFTLEVDDRIESPIVNLHALDCWTFYENALAMARMLGPAHFQPRAEHMLRLVELERYRDGHCDGTYLSRMHHLEEVFANNEKRGWANNITASLPGAERLRRQVREMTIGWKQYRYLRAQPELLEPMAAIEARVSSLPVWHLPKDRVALIEPQLQSGDLCAITTAHEEQYTCHVGLILRIQGKALFMHATSDRQRGRCVIVDHQLTSYLRRVSHHIGVVICRPLEIPLAMWSQGWTPAD